MAAGWAVKMVVGDIVTWATGAEGKRLVFPSAEEAEEHIVGWGPPPAAPTVKVNIEQVEVPDNPGAGAAGAASAAGVNAAGAALPVEAAVLERTLNVEAPVRMLRNWCMWLVAIEVAVIAVIGLLVKSDSGSSGELSGGWSFAFAAAALLFLAVSIAAVSTLLVALPHFLETYRAVPVTLRDENGRLDFTRHAAFDRYEHVTLVSLMSVGQVAFVAGLVLFAFLVIAMAWRPAHGGAGSVTTAFPADATIPATSEAPAGAPRATPAPATATAPSTEPATQH